jgi:hypothetical protein
MTTGLSDAILRLTALEKEALAPVYGPVDAFPAAFAYSARLPYWTNRYAGMTGALNGQDFYLAVQRVEMALHLAQITENFPTQSEQNLWVQIQAVLDYFWARNRLQSVTYPTPMVDIDPRGALITAVSPYQPVVFGGIGGQTVGIVFTIEIPIEVLITPAY